MTTVLYISKVPFLNLIVQNIKEQSEMELIGCVPYTPTDHSIERKADVVLFDTELIPTEESAAAIQQMKAANPIVNVITMIDDSQLDDSITFIEAGSDNIIEKHSDVTDKVMRAILSIQDAHFCVIVNLLKCLDELKKDNFDLFRKRLVENGIHISSKESIVAYFLKKNLRNREIAEHIQIREGTVKVHISQIYRKINIKGRKNVVHYLNEMMSNRVRIKKASTINLNQNIKRSVYDVLS